MSPNTHGEFITGRIDGTTISAFVDGVPDDCQHDWSGDEVFFTQSDKTIYWYTYRQWAHLPSNTRSKLIYDHPDRVLDPIDGAAATCKKCKKIFSPPLFD